MSLSQAAAQASRKHRTSRLVRCGAILLTLSALLACSPSDTSQPSPIFGYRQIDERTISVKASTDTGWETWVTSVDQTPTAVVVAVRTRAPIGGSAPVAKELWLTVKLDAPLGNRGVFDAIGPTQMDLVP
jgi:hypothetical protein